MITEIGVSPGQTGVDFDGDYLIPGLVELHTDQLENHYRPRPRCSGTRWRRSRRMMRSSRPRASPRCSTRCAHPGSDQRKRRGLARIMSTCASARPSNSASAAGPPARRPFQGASALRSAGATTWSRAFRAARSAARSVRLASVMDHAPGQRQFQSGGRSRVLYYQGKRMRCSDATRWIAALSAERHDESRRAIRAAHRQRHRRSSARRAGIVFHGEARRRDARRMSPRRSPQGVQDRGVPDDDSGAAEASHEAGLSVLMGAPNVVRGGSHSGNISAGGAGLAQGVLDVLSSDYIPLSAAAERPSCCRSRSTRCRCRRRSPW